MMEKIMENGDMFRVTNKGGTLDDVTTYIMKLIRI